MVVLVLNRPTARRLRPCKRHASTAPDWSTNSNVKRRERQTRFTRQSGNTTIVFVNTFFHYCFFHHLFDLKRNSNELINHRRTTIFTSRLTVHKSFWRNWSCSCQKKKEKRIIERSTKKKVFFYRQDRCLFQWNRSFFEKIWPSKAESANYCFFFFSCFHSSNERKGNEGTITNTFTKENNQQFNCQLKHQWNLTLPDPMKIPSENKSMINENTFVKVVYFAHRKIFSSDICRKAIVYARVFLFIHSCLRAVYHHWNDI